jgi:quercetin dioxygenase-like cupin family protein
MISKDTFLKLQAQPSKEVMPGFLGRMIHTEQMTFSYWEVKSGSELKEHHHVHEQLSMLMEGRFEFKINGEKRIIEAGEFIVISSDTPHAGKALTDCKIIDVFTPVREDYIF